MERWVKFVFCFDCVSLVKNWSNLSQSATGQAFMDFKNQLALISRRIKCPQHQIVISCSVPQSITGIVDPWGCLLCSLLSLPLCFMVGNVIFRVLWRCWEVFHVSHYVSLLSHKSLRFVNLFVVGEWFTIGRHLLTVSPLISSRVTDRSLWRFTAWYVSFLQSIVSQQVDLIGQFVITSQWITVHITLLEHREENIPHSQSTVCFLEFVRVWKGWIKIIIN